MNPISEETLNSFERHVRVAHYVKLQQEQAKSESIERLFSELMMWRMFDSALMK